MEQQIKKSESFIIIYKKLLIDSDYKLTIDEFYFYVLLVHQINLFTGEHKTSLEMIYNTQTMYKINKSSKKSVMDKIKYIINSLSEKNVLSININLYDKEVNYNSVLAFSQLHIDGGFEKLWKHTYDLCDNRYALYIICFINQSSEKKTDKSINSWRTTLGGIDKNTVSKYINLLCDQGKLFRKEGIINTDDSNEKFTESPTTYSLFPFKDNKKKDDTNHAEDITESPNESKVDVNDDIITKDESSESEIISIEGIQWGNWKNFKVYLEDSDYDLYLEQSHIPEFVEYCDKRLALINKNGKATDVIENMKEAARERLEAKLREKRYVLVDKHRETVISKHHTGQCLTFNNVNSSPEQSDMTSVDVEQFAVMSVSELKKFNTLYTSFDYNEYTYKVEEQSVPFSYGFSEESGLIENCSESTVLKIRDEIVKQMNENGKIDVSKLRSYKQRILDENNKGRPTDVEWEGDHYISSENHSLKQRQRVMGNKSKKESRVDKVTDITRFLDRGKDKSGIVVDGLPF